MPKSGLKGFIALKGQPLAWTFHARERAERKRVRQITAVPWKHFDIVEIEVNGVEVEKWVIRIYHKTHFDVYVILKCGDEFKVITCWRNSINDNHSTLDSTKYDDPKDFPGA